MNVEKVENLCYYVRHERFIELDGIYFVKSKLIERE